jgi:hypothetical protein
MCRWNSAGPGICALDGAGAARHEADQVEVLLAFPLPQPFIQVQIFQKRAIC